MKNNILFVIAAYSCLCFSCVTNIEEPIPAEIQKSSRQMTFEAIAADEANHTKTVRNEDGSLSWTPYDEINVFCGSSLSGRFVSDNTENSTRTTFTGHFNAEPETSQGYWAIYPYNSSNSCDGASVTLTIPALQVSQKGSFGMGMFPSVAKSNTTSLSFYNVCGGLKFSLSRDDIDLVTFKSNGEEAVAGKVRVAFNSSGEPVSKVVEGVAEITLRPSTGDSFVKGADYYISILPGNLSRGFTMTFRTRDGNEGVYEHPDAVTIRRSIFSRKYGIDDTVTSWSEESQGQDFYQSGVYLGILAFNQALYTSPVVLLNQETLNSCLTFVDNLSMKNGTVLYYAADAGLSNMQQAECPVDLVNASMITFTDGLDQGSLMMNSDYETEDNYLAAVSSRIQNGNVSGLPLKAYSIGIRGSDVQNTTKFKNNLIKLASSEQNSFEITAMSELDQRFKEIADLAAVSIEFKHDISLTIPGLPDRTRVRFTFDKVSDASSSTMYIEGTFNLPSRTLSDITYHGLTSKSGTTIRGTETGIFVKFDFSKVRRYDGKEISGDDIKQWQFVEASNRWQINSEFDSATDTDITVSVSRKSAIVYLVLDCSSSLDNQFPKLQDYVKNFIWKLYKDSYIETKAKSVRVNPGELTLEKGETRNLSAIVYPCTALDRSVSWSSSNSGIAVVDQEGVVTGIRAGTTYVYATSSDGGYSASCRVTVLESPESVQAQSSYSQSGLYLGVLAYNQGIYRYPICRLTEESAAEICSFIDNVPFRKGSLVYYSTDEAIEDIQGPSYPANLSNVAMVSFTDCLDQGSLMKTSYTDNEPYLSDIHQKIMRTRIASLPLSAYSIGIRSNDVTNISGYQANLKKLASQDNNAYEITNINLLKDRLDDIAAVVSVTYDYTYNISVTIPGVGNGTRVRITFDNVYNASASALYIEGTFNLATRTLSDIVYYGFSEHPGTSVNGAVDGIFVTFSFDGLRIPGGSSMTFNNTKEWTAESGHSNWQINSEFDSSTNVSSQATVRKKSGVIYLVLDYSTSIESKGYEMKRAAKDFIRALQAASYDPYAVSSVKLQGPSSVDGLGEYQMTAIVSPDTAKDKTVVWTSSDESVATVSQEGLVTTHKAGVASIVATSNDGGYSDSLMLTVNKTLPSNIYLNKSNIWLKPGESDYLEAMIEPNYATETDVEWSSSNEDAVKVSADGKVTIVGVGGATVTVTTKVGNKEAHCDIVSYAIKDGFWEIDLGLPSGVKWAANNIGASTQEEGGTSFSWGETTSKKESAWSVYKWCNGSRNTILKYNTKSEYGVVDNMTSLLLDDDAARSNWGGCWRTPTKEEFDELLNNCWMSRTSQNGHSGHRLTSKKNGNFIFLPDPSNASFWSSSLDVDSPYRAWGLQLYMAGWFDGVSKFERYTSHVIRPVNDNNIEVHVKGVSLERTQATIIEGDKLVLKATVLPSNATDQAIIWSSSDSSIAEVGDDGEVRAIVAGTATIRAQSVDGGITAICEVQVRPSIENGHKWVDLKLPSGLKWSICNIGADDSAGYGDYFSWGEITSKSDYSWTTYKWCKKSDTSLTRYNCRSYYGMVIDNRSTLYMEDDVARALWGGSWRMPTKADFSELIDGSNCSKQWVQNNGVNGHLITSKKNGKSIFLPVAGYKVGASLTRVNAFGYYWSASLDTDFPSSAWYLYINENNVKNDFGHRYNGFSVRPVCE